MKKITVLLSLLTLTVGLHAKTVDVGLAYTGDSHHFDRVQASATVALNLNVLAGLEAKMTSERAFKDPVYAVSMPLALDLELIRISLRPFYYFKNKSDNPAFQDASAFGIATQLRMAMREDEVNDIYSHAFISAAFARQKGTVFFNDGTDQNRYYSQMAYSLGLSNTFFNAFGLDLMGTIFQYPNGITDVAGLRSIMDQQELANLQTLDVVHQLPNYTVGARLTRLWADNGSSLYVGYRYGEFHSTADKPEHSLIVGNSFIVAQRVSLDVMYNHVRTVHNKNRRDILAIQLNTSF
ncbi:MAG: hypothetical protein MJ053_01680 [Elusimicrobiaceae bacterium]|nr:hypothetical protein [Elusimicrobiaceae bacterium]